MRATTAVPRGRCLPRPPARGTRRPVTAAGLALLLAACSGGEGTDPGARSAATSAPAGENGQLSATADPGEDAADRTAATAPQPRAARTDNPQPEDPPDRVVASRDGAFEVERPEGWSDVSDEVPKKIQLAIREDTVSGDFFANLVVAREEPIPDLEQAVEEAADDVAGADGEHEMLDPTEVDGVPAYGYLVRRTSEGSKVAQVQRWLEHEDHTYVLTFSTAAGQAEEQAPVLEEILSGWTWTD